ncbi:MAG: hypothetical protein JNK85_18485 [Verrucomicrobiales bacterium]|nr:hypothetical protein [Verrucomicrobiales bacterium]
MGRSLGVLDIQPIERISVPILMATRLRGVKVLQQFESPRPLGHFSLLN